MFPLVNKSLLNDNILHFYKDVSCEENVGMSFEENGTFNIAEIVRRTFPEHETPKAVLKGKLFKKNCQLLTKCHCIFSYGRIQI